ncbi:uncharacterized protein LY89DRAFT_357792 [Mollisia scopiformis]|uniref:Uncharacterized protein n=1 Tax=Mollisia scopiformis TaxID=149040 RepID=A0A132B575_MOLSC|nr:uncharacterized protein LY89DRAFT_357792 [Mollisia scopiformis]KUJ07566.1 hypothetical protein LY89DRAFT_357792 [Mollisia scopiformis]
MPYKEETESGQNSGGNKQIMNESSNHRKNNQRRTPEFATSQRVNLRTTQKKSQKIRTDPPSLKYINPNTNLTLLGNTARLLAKKSQYLWTDQSANMNQVHVRPWFGGVSRLWMSV